MLLTGNLFLGWTSQLCCYTWCVYNYCHGGNMGFHANRWHCCSYTVVLQ